MLAPDSEIDLLINTVAAANDLASAGELVDGHAELVYGLRRMEVIRDEGKAWAVTLGTRYRLAVDAYCDLYGLRLE